MSLPRVALIVLVIGTAVAGFYFVATNPLQLGEKTLGTAISELTPKPSSSPAELLTQKSQLEINPAQNPASTEIQKQSAESVNNLTEQITQNLSQFLIGRITSDNTDGPTTQNDGTGGLLVPGQQEITSFMDENLGNISAQSPTDNPGSATYHPKVYETKFAIIHNPSRTDKVSYLKNLIGIGTQYSGGVKKSDSEILNDLMGSGDTSGAKQLEEMYGSVADAYTKLSVPENWLSTHKAILSYYFTAQSVWNDIANYTEDPVRAMVGIKTLDILGVANKGIPQLIHDEMVKDGITSADLK